LPIPLLSRLPIDYAASLPRVKARALGPLPVGRAASLSAGRALS